MTKLKFFKYSFKYVENFYLLGLFKMSHPYFCFLIDLIENNSIFEISSIEAYI